MKWSHKSESYHNSIFVKIKLDFDQFFDFNLKKEYFALKMYYGKIFQVFKIQNSIKKIKLMMLWYVLSIIFFAFFAKNWIEHLEKSVWP